MNTVLVLEENSKGIHAAMTQGGDQQLEFLLANTISSTVDALGGQAVDTVLVHLPVSGSSAGEVLAAIIETGSKAPIILYEPEGTVRRSVELTRQGAFQHIAHAVKPGDLREVVLQAVRHRSANVISTGSQPRDWRATLVGSSSAMQEVTEIIELVGNRRSTVLITGETGTGKEVVARALHMASNRSASRMVAVNCAALPDHLLEAELFGHTRGAFTGAVNARVGLFEQAHRSTIFLDEIGEMPLPLQAKLLRVLQERELQRIGSSEPISIDVRVIAASNTNLLEAVASRRFREDLYYRLNVVALRMPSLRERPSDIPELAVHFLDKIAEHEPAWRKTLSPQALEHLARYAWPGNVRQLEHALESAVALSGARTVLYPGDFDLPAEVRAAEIGPLSNLDVPETGINFEELIAGIERRLLERALAKSGGNKARAASMLQMKRTTLISKFKSLEVCA